MKSDQPSATARGVAAMRAAHLQGDPPYIFEDPFALDLAGPEWQERHAAGELQDFFVKAGLARLQGQIVGRARWAEDALASALAAGVNQYVIVGAGLDSFVLRRTDLLPGLRVFELDHPASQVDKLEQLHRLGRVPEHAVEFVATDLELETVGDALSRTGFSRQTPAFFAWLGVVAYLSEGALYDTLSSIRACSAPGSVVAFDYPIHPELLEPDIRALFERIRQDSAELGEPRRATHHPETLEARVRALGYELVEDLSSDQHAERYFAGRSDGLLPYPQIHLASFRTL